MPYTTDWVMTNGDDPDIEASSFVHSFAWASSDLGSRDSPADDDIGRLLVCLNPDGQGKDRYVYLNIPYAKFELLRDVAYSGGSVGSTYNDELKHNPDVPDAVSLSDVQDGEKDAEKLAA